MYNYYVWNLEKKLEGTKLSWLKLLLKRKITVTLMVILIFLIGTYASTKMDRELLPSVSFDGAAIYVSAGDMSAVDVEREISIPLEQMLLNLNDVKTIDSSTTVGSSTIMVIADDGRGEDVYKEIETLVNGVEHRLNGVDHLHTFQFSTDQPYEFYMDITNGSFEDMSTFALDVVKPRLEALPEVREVDLQGLEETRVVIEFDVNKVQEIGVSIEQILPVIIQANTESTLGKLAYEEGNPTVRLQSEIVVLNDLKQLEIPTMNGIVELQEIASIFKEQNQNSTGGWKNGTSEFILVAIGRVKGVTQVEMAETVRAEIEAIKAEGLVQGFEFEELVAQADYVTEAIDGVSTNVLYGGLFALIILMLFLRNVRATVIIALSIPLSILLTFTAMWFFGYSFNMLTLIGLGLGIGMMVDSSIVILESIYRRKELGEANLDAVLNGVKEVASPVIASMLTTVVVFLPVGILGGEIGKFVLILSMIIVITLVSSLIVAFTLIPALSENFLKLSKKSRSQKEGKVSRLYGKVINWISKKKWCRYVTITMFIIMFISSTFLTTKIPTTVMPDVFNRYAELIVQLESGLTPSEREEIALKINERLETVPDVRDQMVMDSVDMLFVLINMTTGDEITLEQDKVNDQIMRELRQLEDEYPILGVGPTTSIGVSLPIVIDIKGPDHQQLNDIAKDVMVKLDQIEGIVGITSNAEKTAIEQVVSYREDRMEEDGLTKLQVLSQLQLWSTQIPIGHMNLDDVSTPLMIKTDINFDNKQELLHYEIVTPLGLKPLSNYIELVEHKVPVEISRKDGTRVVKVLADFEGTDIGTINREVDKVLSEYDVPAGYIVQTAGSLQEQQEIFQDLLIILFISIFLVYVVMAVQFNSFIHPIIVMTIIPLTATGAFLGLFLTNSELSALSGMGLVFLVGIVLNNAILLIDRTNQLREEGLTASEALVEAGKNRLRPIFMTTLTTAAGMFPLAIASGTSSNYQAPLAIVVISGLLFATFITLVLIPSVYLTFEDVKRGLRKLVRQKPQKQTVTTTTNIEN